MTIDCTKVTDTFAAYAAGYNADDPKIKLKIQHTYRVASLSRRIAGSLRLPEADVELAWLIGMLHDVGRFEQVTRYGTFSDAASVEHAALGVEILFDEGHIRDYVADDREDALIRTAIACHSLYRLPAGLDERTLLFCKLIRDADKVDIWKVNCETPLEDIYNVTTEELYSSAVTPAVLEAFLEEHCILRSLRKTAVDNVVGTVSLAFELEFPESLKIGLEQGYLETLLAFSSKNSATKADFKRINDALHRYIAQKIQQN